MRMRARACGLSRGGRGGLAAVRAKGEGSSSSSSSSAAGERQTRGFGNSADRSEQSEFFSAIGGRHHAMVDERHDVWVLDGRVHFDLPARSLGLLRQLREHLLERKFLTTTRIHEEDKGEASLCQLPDDAQAPAIDRDGRGAAAGGAAQAQEPRVQARDRVTRRLEDAVAAASASARAHSHRIHEGRRRDENALGRDERTGHRQQREVRGCGRKESSVSRCAARPCAHSSPHTAPAESLLAFALSALPVPSEGARGACVARCKGNEVILLESATNSRTLYHAS